MVSALCRAPGACQHARHGRPTQEQGTAHEHDDGGDVGADPLEERGGGPVEALPHRAPVLGVEAGLEVVVAQRPVGPEAERPRRDGEEQGAEHEDPAGVDRRRSLDERAQHERGPPRGEHDRHGVGDLPRNVGEPGLRPAADAAPVPVAVEHEREVEAQRDEGDADDIEVALVEPAERLAGLRAQVPRGLARLGARGRRPARGTARGLSLDRLTFTASTQPP